MTRARHRYTTYGFSQVVGHGVADAVIEAAHTLAKRFFETTDEGQRSQVGDAVLNDRGERRRGRFLRGV